MEIEMNKVDAYLSIYRTDLADKKVKEMKSVDDEHVCTLLSDLHLQVMICLWSIDVSSEVWIVSQFGTRIERKVFRLC